jgi:hypothetical protein
VYKNLNKMVNEPKIKDLNDLIKYLKNRGYRFGDDIANPSEALNE